MLGWLISLAGTITLGARLRSDPGKRNAERTSGILHLLFWITVVPLAALGILYPGLTGLDRELGLSALPRHPVILLSDALGLLVGVYLFVVSNIALGLAHSG